MKDGCNNYQKMIMGVNFGVIRVSFYGVAKKRWATYLKEVHHFSSEFKVQSAEFLGLGTMN
jgi:hypothetical protein